MNSAYIRLLIFLYTVEKSSVDFDIANVLLKQIKQFPDILIEDIAAKAHTTPASVTKFCHKLQYKSFKELRNDGALETHQRIQQQLRIAKTSYEEACLCYEKEAAENLHTYLQMYQEESIQQVARIIKAESSICICYPYYAYSCVHVFRNYLESFPIQVVGVLREGEEAFLKTRSKESAILFIISLQGTYIHKHQQWLREEKQAGKKIIIITAIYDETIKELASFIFPFAFLGDTILDSATQISTLFIKIAFACANFPKLEKNRSAN